MTMSIGEILRIGAIDTALGMGTVFAILIFISICIWLMGIILRPKNKAAEQGGALAAEAQPVSEDPSAIDPEIIAVISAAIHQYLKDEQGYGDNDEYVVRKVRRATWKHTS